MSISTFLKKTQDPFRSRPRHVKLFLIDDNDSNSCIYFIGDAIRLDACIGTKQLVNQNRNDIAILANVHERWGLFMIC